MVFSIKFYQSTCKFCQSSYKYCQVRNKPSNISQSFFNFAKAVKFCPIKSHWMQFLVSTQSLIKQNLLFFSLFGNPFFLSLRSSIIPTFCLSLCSKWQCLFPDSRPPQSIIFLTAMYKTKKSEAEMKDLLLGTLHIRLQWDLLSRLEPVADAINKFKSRITNYFNMKKHSDWMLQFNPSECIIW